DVVRAHLPALRVGDLEPAAALPDLADEEGLLAQRIGEGVELAEPEEDSGRATELPGGRFDQSLPLTRVVLEQALRQVVPELVASLVIVERVRARPEDGRDRGGIHTEQRARRQRSRRPALRPEPERPEQRAAVVWALPVHQLLLGVARLVVDR